MTFAGTCLSFPISYFPNKKKLIHDADDEKHIFQIWCLSLCQWNAEFVDSLTSNIDNIKMDKWYRNMNLKFFLHLVKFEWEKYFY